MTFSFAPIASFSSYLSMLSPIPFLYSSLLSHPSRLPHVTYASVALMQMSWMIYGHCIRNKSLFFVAFSSMILHSIYFSLSVLAKHKIHYILMLLGVGLTGAFFIEKLGETAGGVCCVVQVAASLTHLEFINKAFKEKDGSFFSIKSLFMSIPSSFNWVIYGLELFNFNIVIPSFLDFMIGLTELYCIMAFKKKEKKPE